MRIPTLYKKLTEAGIAFTSFENIIRRHLTHNCGGAYGARTVVDTAPAVRIMFPDGEERTWTLKDIEKVGPATAYRVGNKDIEAIFNAIVRRFDKQADEMIARLAVNPRTLNMLKPDAVKASEARVAERKAA